jgi:hypothetical protein
VDVRSKPTGVVQSSNTNESDLGPVAVITPKSSLAFGAAKNVVWTISTGHPNGFQVAACYLYRRSFDDRIENKCAACVPLTIRAMAAVHTDRLSQELVAHLAARTAAFESLAFAIGTLLHVFQIHVCAATLCCSRQNAASASQASVASGCVEAGGGG